MSSTPITSFQPTATPVGRRSDLPAAAPTPSAPSELPSASRTPTDRLSLNAAPETPEAPLSDVVRRAREAQEAQAREQRIQEVLAESPSGIIGDSIKYWEDLAQGGGAQAAIGKTFVGLLEFSGLASLERSAAELGARVGADDSTANIAKAGGKLALDAGIVALNAVAAGKAVTSAARAAGAVLGLGETAAQALPTVVRHYTSAAAAESIMKDGMLVASKAGSSGFNKVYLLAEEGSNVGMNALRRLNIGHAGSARTAAAIEINLAKLPPEALAQFQRESARGLLGLENFVTHLGNLDLKAMGDAVRLVDAGQMAVTAEQLLKSGASLLGVGSAVTSANRAAQGVVR